MKLNRVLVSLSLVIIAIIVRDTAITGYYYVKYGSMNWVITLLQLSAQYCKAEAVIVRE